MELITRWRQDEFDLLYSDDLFAEIADKFPAKRISAEHTINLLVELHDKATHVEVKPADIKPVIAADPDDDFILACAVVGQADYLGSYDTHFDALNGEYHDVKIVEPIAFLQVVRGDRKPEPLAGGE